ncbi:histone-lysine N-methyltransferase SETMAR [Trichonephila clavipes]|nr:histone-lysine N-methyltransferase SETMAR [Trichonephila clavipes]
MVPSHSHTISMQLGAKDPISKKRKTGSHENAPTPSSPLIETFLAQHGILVVSRIVLSALQYIEILVIPLDKLQKTLPSKRALHTEEAFNGYGRKTTQQVIRKKRREILRSGVLLLDDSVTATQNHIATLGWEHLNYPPYSPDFALSVFHLFLALKKNLAGRRFGSNAEISNKPLDSSSVCKALSFSWRAF